MWLPFGDSMAPRAGFVTDAGKIVQNALVAAGADSNGERPS